MTSDRVELCRRCGARDAAAPDGFAVFLSRNLFGPRVERDLCQPCFSRGLWEKSRLLIVAASVAFAGYNAWGGRWLGVGAALGIGAVWWWISSRAIRALDEGSEADAR